MTDADKKEFYDLHHLPIVQAVETLMGILEEYADSRTKSIAHTRLQEAYLWMTQMIQHKLQDKESAVPESNIEEVIDEVIQQETGS